MEWLKRMNDALSYMEDNLDGEISIEKAAQKACCSQYHFQRMFSYIIGVPLSEYLRRRRITKAAFDLQNGDKVIDVALRYGYDSPTAFNRAFQAIHGISPSLAQKSDTVLKAFPPVSFQMTIKGVTEMDYRIVEKEGFRAVGVRIDLGVDTEVDMEKNFKTITAFWEETINAGLTKQIVKMMNSEPYGLLAVSTTKEDNKGGFYYICSATDKPVPDGMLEVQVPKHTWAIFPGSGHPSSIGDLFKRIYSEWQPTSGYEWADMIEIEVYLDDDETNMRYEVWMPVVKKS
ncbi:MAG: AraC family transcriptional regulator [Defluviitaleaceae bacterium]|nr:AraC family transcriptional regulator [Defluviitaleaceae bacterium]